MRKISSINRNLKKNDEYQMTMELYREKEEDKINTIRYPEKILMVAIFVICSTEKTEQIKFDRFMKIVRRYQIPDIKF